jgi:hypothetical protein
MTETPTKKCQWPGCEERVFGWACATHWMRLPAHLRSALFRAHGHEEQNPEYEKTAAAVQRWIAANFPNE